MDYRSLRWCFALMALVVGAWLSAAGCGGRAERRATNAATIAASIMQQMSGETPALLGFVEIYPTRVTANQKVSILFLLVNAGKAPVVVDARMIESYNLYVSIKDSQGRPIASGEEYGVMVAEATREDFVTLRPGQFVGSALLETTPRHWSVHTPGGYRVGVRCILMPERAVPSAWAGGVLSDLAAVTISPERRSPETGRH